MTVHARIGRASAGLDPAFAAAVLTGLSGCPKSLPCRYFYDQAGSALFEEITRLEAYYPTRSEIAILTHHARAIASRTPPGSTLVEFGSGSSRKTEILLRALPSLAAYVPVDVCEEALDEAARRLRRRFPGLLVAPVVGDFSIAMTLPACARDRPLLGFFPGSTIGNLVPAEARRLLARFARLLEPAGRLVIGVDLEKDEDRLVEAYDDPAGVTARFNLNLLRRINRELGGTFNVGAFSHKAAWDDGHGRIDMFLVSRRRQSARVLGRTFRFETGETVHTEHSYKFTIAGFQQLARTAGWYPAAVWTDPAGLFSVHELTLG